MPSKSESQRRLFGLALSYKRGETKKVSKKVKDIADKMSEKELEKYASSVKEEKKELEEVTTSASSGSYESPFAISKKDMKNLENLKETYIKIKRTDIESIIKKTLIKEEVYNQSPTKAKDKAYKANNGKGKKHATKTGAESKKITNEVTKKVEENQKNNLKDAQVVDPNKNKKQNEEQRIEAYQNGMQDLTYDSISDEKKKINKKYITDGDSEDSKVGQQMIDDAKKREESKAKSSFRKAKAFGSDVEFNPEAKDAEEKNLAFENKRKRLNFKKLFESEKAMLKKIPNKYKQDDLVFEMFDGQNKYLIRWEGSEKNGLGVVLNHRNPVLEAKEYERMQKLGGYKSQTTKSTKNDEKSVMVEMLKANKEMLK